MAIVKNAKNEAVEATLKFGRRSDVGASIQEGFKQFLKQPRNGSPRRGWLTDLSANQPCRGGISWGTNSGCQLRVTVRPERESDISTKRALGRSGSAFSV